MLKLFIPLSIVMMLCSCATVKTPEENLQDLANKEVAAVISGCKLKYKTHNTFFPDTEEEGYCRTSWTNSKTNKWYPFVGYTSINFIPPGTYEFRGFSGAIDRDMYIAYSSDEKEPGPEIFTKITIKGGDVVYVGNFEINVIDSKLVLRAIRPFSYRDETIKGILGRQYPTLVPRLERKLVEFTPEAEFVKTMFPVIEEK